MGESLFMSNKEYNSFTFENCKGCIIGFNKRFKVEKGRFKVVSRGESNEGTMYINT
jgi:hypothetical protein